MCEKFQTTSGYAVEEKDNQTITSAEIDIEVNVNNEGVINNALGEEENNVSDPIVFDVDIGDSIPYGNIHGYLIKMIMLTAFICYKKFQGLFRNV